VSSFWSCTFRQWQLANKAVNDNCTATADMSHENKMRRLTPPSGSGNFRTKSFAVTSYIWSIGGLKVELGVRLPTKKFQTPLLYRHIFRRHFYQFCSNIVHHRLLCLEFRNTITSSVDNFWEFSTVVVTVAWIATEVTAVRLRLTSVTTIGLEPE